MTPLAPAQVFVTVRPGKLRAASLPTAVTSKARAARKRERANRKGGRK